MKENNKAFFQFTVLCKSFTGSFFIYYSIILLQFILYHGLIEYMQSLPSWWDTLLGMISAKTECTFGKILWNMNHIISLNLQVGVQTSQVHMLPTDSELLSWETFNEDISSVDDDKMITVAGLLEQLNITRDTSDYLWYTTRWILVNFAFFCFLDNK